jgi:hypothetical protein
MDNVNANKGCYLIGLTRESKEINIAETDVAKKTTTSPFHFLYLSTTS